MARKTLRRLLSKHRFRVFRVDVASSDPEICTHVVRRVDPLALAPVRICESLFMLQLHSCPPSGNLAFSVFLPALEQMQQNLITAPKIFPTQAGRVKFTYPPMRFHVALSVACEINGRGRRIDGW